jgi:hypothetical protein
MGINEPLSGKEKVASFLFHAWFAAWVIGAIILYATGMLKLLAFSIPNVVWCFVIVALLGILIVIGSLLSQKGSTILDALSGTIATFLVLGLFSHIIGSGLHRRQSREFQRQRVNSMKKSPTTQSHKSIPEQPLQHPPHPTPRR